MTDSDYRWLNETGALFLSRDYLLPGQTLDERVDQICDHAAYLLQDPAFARRLKYIIQRGWVSLATPVFTNFGTDRGLPISCFGSYTDDSMTSILDTVAEVGTMTKYGGGTSAYFGSLRPRGASIRNNGTSSGAVHFMNLFNAVIDVVSQGTTRRGSFAAYLDIDHPDFDEFLPIRDKDHPIQLLAGACVSSRWLQEMRDGDKAKQQTWANVLKARNEKGTPYIFFSDNMNNQAPEVYRANNMRIHASNLCTEIALSSSPDESFVCCLSSMNLLHYDEWKNTDAVQIMIMFLDAVMQDFVNKARDIPHLARAVRFAENQRALGLGVLGWHSLLQKKGFPFESMQAKSLTSEVFKHIRSEADEASAHLAKLYGESPLLKGWGRRNVTVLAVAPTKSSSMIFGQVSEGIEPLKGNYYVRDTAKGKFSYKNPMLVEVLEALGENTDVVWDQILRDGGSVRSLPFLSDHDKGVFKTFEEISPNEVIIQASIRQKFIDQAQSINLMIHPDTPVRDVNALMLRAHDLGIKSLYYQHNINAAQQAARDILACASCEA